MSRAVIKKGSCSFFYVFGSGKKLHFCSSFFTISPRKAFGPFFCKKIASYRFLLRFRRENIFWLFSSARSAKIFFGNFLAFLAFLLFLAFCGSLRFWVITLFSSFFSMALVKRFFFTALGGRHSWAIFARICDNSCANPGRRK